MIIRSAQRPTFANTQKFGNMGSDLPFAGLCPKVRCRKMDQVLQTPLPAHCCRSSWFQHSSAPALCRHPRFSLAILATCPKPCFHTGILCQVLVARIAHDVLDHLDHLDRRESISPLASRADRTVRLVRPCRGTRGG